MSPARRIAKEALGGASYLMLVFGSGYLLDCRLTGGERDNCWFTAAGYMGIGGAGRIAYQAGFWTPNPAISQETRSRVAPIDKPEG